MSPLKKSQRLLRSLIVQSLTAFLATSIEMPQAGSGPMNGRLYLSLATGLPFQIPSRLLIYVLFLKLNTRKYNSRPFIKTVLNFERNNTGLKKLST
jgi:hypothetical protein